MNIHYHEKNRITSFKHSKKLFSPISISLVSETILVWVLLIQQAEQTNLPSLIAGHKSLGKTENESPNTITLHDQLCHRNANSNNLHNPIRSKQKDQDLGVWPYSNEKSASNSKLSKMGIEIREMLI